MVLSDEKKEEIAKLIFHQKKNAEYEAAWGMEVMLNLLVGNDEFEEVLELIKKKTGDVG